MIVKGITFTTCLALGLTVSYLLLLPLTLTIPFIWRPLYQIRKRYAEFINKVFFSCAANFVHYLGPTVYIHSNEKDNIFQDREVIMICNHRTRVDIIFAGWCYATLFHVYPFIAVILKNDLKYIPLFGWCMQFMMYIFLSRKREEDLPYLAKMVKYAEKVKAKTSYFIFPEGTDLSESRKMESHEYAKSKGLRLLNQVLYPKSAALHKCLESMHDQNNIVLHDITIAYKDYKDGERFSEENLVLGRFPKEVHIYVKRFRLYEVPKQERELKEWLTALFLQKEDLLSEFYQQGKTSFPQFDRLNSTAEVPQFRRTLNLSLLIVLLLAICIIIAKIPLLRYLFIIHITLGIFSSRFGGFDRLELYLASNF